MSEPQHPKSHSENFTLHDFIEVKGKTLEERVGPFSQTLKHFSDQGWTLYSRELVGPPGPRVQVKDPLTGKISSMIMMGSNDYLGFSYHPEIIKAVIDSVTASGVGMGGPPLLNGMSSIHRQLEKELAELKEQEDALIFNSGFQANLGWTYALLRPGDFVIYDELNHASFFDGLSTVKATRKIKAYSFLHNDLSDLERLLKFAQSKQEENQQIFVVVEGVYSMDGDLAPLVGVTDLCEKFSATLVLDDAHGTGVIGENGGGTSEHFHVSSKVDLSMGTFSKSFGVTGGFIAGKKSVIDYLRFFSRSYLFSAHLPQSIATAVLKGCQMMKNQPQLRTQLHHNVRFMLEGLKRLGFQVHSESAIIPVRIPQEIDLRIFNRTLHQKGLFVNPIEYPAVSIDQQRIRLSLMANHEEKDLAEALQMIESTAREMGLI